MEQTLTTIAFISAALFIVWILLVDPAAEDVHAGLDMTFLGALLMVPVIIAVLIGIALLFPVIVAIALIGLLLYGLFMLLRWFVTREKTETSSEPPKDSRILGSLRRIEKGVKALGTSRPVRAAQERVKESGTRVRASFARNSEKVRNAYQDRRQKVRESPKNFKESIARVREGTVKKAHAIREKMDRTIAAGKERSHTFRERGAKNTADAMQSSSSQRKAETTQDSVSRAKDSQHQSLVQNRGAVTQERRENSSDESRERSSASKVSDRNNSSYQDADHAKTSDAHSHFSKSRSRDYKDSKESDNFKTVDHHSFLRGRLSQEGNSGVRAKSSQNTNTSDNASHAKDSSTREDVFHTKAQDQSHSTSLHQTHTRDSRSPGHKQYSTDEQSSSSKDSQHSSDAHNPLSSTDHKNSRQHIAQKKDALIRQQSTGNTDSAVRSASSGTAPHDRSTEMTSEHDITAQGNSLQHHHALKSDLSQKKLDNAHTENGDQTLKEKKDSDSGDRRESENHSSGKKKFSDDLQTKSSALVNGVSDEDSDNRLQSLQQDENVRGRNGQSEKNSANHRNRKGSLSLRDRYNVLRKRIRNDDVHIHLLSDPKLKASSRTADGTSLRKRFMAWTRNIVYKLDGRKAKNDTARSKANPTHGIRGLRRFTDTNMDLFSEEYLRNMRPIGWKTRRKMDETYRREKE